MNSIMTTKLVFLEWFQPWHETMTETKYFTMYQTMTDPKSSINISTFVETFTEDICARLVLMNCLRKGVNAPNQRQKQLCVLKPTLNAISALV